jgi:hypothetical protein
MGKKTKTTKLEHTEVKKAVPKKTAGIKQPKTTKFDIIKLKNEDTKDVRRFNGRRRVRMLSRSGSSWTPHENFTKLVLEVMKIKFGYKLRDLMEFLPGRTIKQIRNKGMHDGRKFRDAACLYLEISKLKPCMGFYNKDQLFHQLKKMIGSKLDSILSQTKDEKIIKLLKNDNFSFNVDMEKIKSQFVQAYPSADCIKLFKGLDNDLIIELSNKDYDLLASLAAKTNKGYPILNYSNLIDFLNKRFNY